MRDGTPNVLPKDGVEMFSLKRVILFGVSQFVKKTYRRLGTPRFLKIQFDNDGESWKV